MSKNSTSNPTNATAPLSSPSQTSLTPTLVAQDQGKQKSQQTTQNSKNDAGDSKNPLSDSKFAQQAQKKGWGSPTATQPRLGF